MKDKELIHKIEDIIDSHITIDYEEKHAYAAAIDIWFLIKEIKEKEDKVK